MKKFKYQKIENYEKKKQNILNAVQKENGGVLPVGYDNDIFISALIKIIEHLENNYKTTIKAEDIPDVASFTRQKKEYSITSFVLNRVLKNVKSVNFEKIRPDKPEAIGGFTAGLQNLTMYTSAFEKKLLKIKDLDVDEQFASEQDCFTILFESAIIHELIHAISFNGKYVGFRKNEESRDINEGMTESLAKEISHLHDLAIVDVFLQNYSRYLVKTKTNSSYYLQTNIFDLIRVASKEDMTIPYLVDVDKIKFGHSEKLKTYKGNPLEIIKTLLNKSIKYDKEEDPFTEEIKIVNNGDFSAYQELQTIIIEDIFENKYGKEFLDKIRQSGKAPTQEEYDKFKHDMIIIGRSIVSTLKYKLDDEEKKDFAQNDYFSTSQDIMKLIQNGTIEPTPNVLRYRDLLFAMENVQKDFAKDLTI